MPEDTWSPLICEDRPDTYPDVTVTLPGELALALVRHGPRLIEVITREQRLAMIDDVGAKRRHEAELAAHQRKMTAAGVQAYRLWRRVLADTKDRNQQNARLNDLCAELVRQHGPFFSREHTRHLIQHRKSLVADYLSARRIRERNRTVVRLYLDGASNGEIAARVGVSKGHVTRLIKANAEAIAEARRAGLS